MNRIRPLLARLTRYASVSMVTVAVTQTVLLVGLVAGLDPVAANVTAVSTAAVPGFLLNRRWVWQQDGRADLWREVVPFWTLAIAGLALSTLAVAAADRLTDSRLATAAANLSGFAVLWVLRFVVLDRWVFTGQPQEGQT